MNESLFNSSELFDVLRKYNMVPQLVNAAPYGQSGAGLFKAGPNVIVAADPSATQFPSIRNQRTDTLTHELTHAAQMNLLYPALEEIKSKQQNRKTLTSEEQRFSDAMSKLMNNNDSLKNMLQKMFTSSGDRSSDKYRTSPIELQAWGAGYMSVPSDPLNKEKKNINPHLNPSMATEFALLLDLFEKLPNDVKQKSVGSVVEEIQKNRKKDTGDFYRESKPMTKNPFVK